MKPHIKRQSGSVLLEALIAAAITGFGLLSLGKLQSTLIQNTGFNREQSIAMKLAESKIEELRAYETIATTSGKVSYTGSLVTGNATSTQGMTAFTTNWTVTPRTDPDYKEVTVSVNWTDFQGTPRSIQTGSIISPNDPLSLASLVKNFTEPGNPIQPFNRVLKVPIPAINNGDGTSTFTPPGSAASITLDNTTGNVKTATGITIGENETAFLLSGYVGFGTGSDKPDATHTSNISFLLIQTSSDSPLSNYSCWDDSHLAAAAKAYSGFVTYSCVIKSNTTVTVNGVAVPAWSGRLRASLDGAGRRSKLWLGNIILHR
jgi:Tfp pilus assembly protein PilV